MAYPSLPSDPQQPGLKKSRKKIRMLLVFTRATRSTARYLLWKGGWLAGCLSHAGIVSKRLNLF